jgi:hypothetical protein
MKRFLATLGILLAAASAQANTFETLGVVAASSRGTAIVGGLNSFSAWQDMGTSTIAAKSMWIFINEGDGTPFVIEFATGASPSSALFQIVWDQVGTAGAALMGGVFGPIQVNIASSTQYNLRVEANSTPAGDETAYFTILISDEKTPDIASGHAYASYGINTGVDGKGTTVDPGGTAHTDGSWTEITPTAAAQSGILEFHLFIGNNTNGTAATATWLVDIATGTPGSESVQINDIFLAASTSSDQILPVSVVLPGENFASQRFHARARCSITDATDRILTIQAMTIAGTAAAGGGGNSVMPVGRGGGLVSR